MLANGKPSFSLFQAHSTGVYSGTLIRLKKRRQTAFDNMGIYRRIRS